MRAIVLGASVQALACACELAIRGACVTIAQSRRQQSVMLGRKLQGFSFDTSETMITQPDALVSLFYRAGREIADYLAIVPIDPFVRAWFEDGVVINVRRDAGLFALQLDQQFPLNRQGANYCSVMLAQRKGHDVGAREARRRISEPHIAALTDCLYLRPDSWGTSAVNSGMWYTFGGVRQVGFALERLSAELGVQQRVGNQVSQVTSGNSQPAVSVDGEVMAADHVIDCDAKPRVKYASWFIGINRLYPQLALNNVFFTQGGQGIRVATRCALDPAHAPVGGDVIRIDVPCIQDSDRPALALEDTFALLKKCGMSDLGERVVIKRAGTEFTLGHDAGLAVMQGRKMMESIVSGPIDARPEAVTSDV